MQGMKTTKTPANGSAEALNEAIQHAGGLPQFVEKINAPSAGAVKAWRQNGVPAAYCPTIERVTGVVCERLNGRVEWFVLRKALPVAPAANDPA